MRSTRLDAKRLERHVRRALAELPWWLEKVQHPRTQRFVTRLEYIAERANDDCDEALKAVSYDAVKRGGQELTQPEAYAERALACPDLTAERMTRLAGTLSLIADSSIAARRLGEKLTTSTEERDRAATAANAAAQAGMGCCENCTEWVPGTRADRLVAGRCRRCYEFKRDHDGNERPRHLWGGEEAS